MSSGHPRHLALNRAPHQFVHGFWYRGIIELPPFGPLPFAHGSQSGTARALACGHSGAGHARTGTRRRSRLTLIPAVLALAGVSACQPGERPYRVVDSEFMEFGELFSPVDTVRFDASVLVGTMSFVDLSDQGDFLITDDQMDEFHFFSASGEHVRTFAVSQCNPEGSGFLHSARFLADGSVIAKTSGGAYAFSTDGSCKKRLLELPSIRPSFCEWRGHTYFLNTSLSPPRIFAWSLDSGIVEEYDLRMPAFPSITSAYRGIVGRELACFDRGVFFRYAESSDAEPLFPGNEPVVHRPTHFRPIRRDMIRTDDMGARTDDVLDLMREATFSSGIFELDESRRLVKFHTWGRQTQINIVNMETQTSVSSITDLLLEVAEHGILYVLGDYEPLPSGEMGNQMLEVWRFIPFEP